VYIVLALYIVLLYLCRTFKALVLFELGFFGRTSVFCQYPLVEIHLLRKRRTKQERTNKEEQDEQIDKAKR